MANRITDKDSLRIRILAATERFTPQEVSTYFEDRYTPDQIKRHLASKEPALKSKLKRETSRGGVKLKAILAKIFPNVTIREEYHVGEKLRLDFYVGQPYNLGFEFDGVQHKKFTPHLHKDEEAYVDGLERDARKEELCKGRGVKLVRISHDDDMDLDFVKSKIDKSGYGTGYIKDGFETGKEKHKVKQKDLNKVIAERKRQQYQQYKASDSYKKQQAKQKEHRKDQYKKQKEWRKNNIKK